MKKKLLFIGYRAYGDWIYASAVLPILFKQYDVYLDMNIKGNHLFEDDPRFKQKALFVFENEPPEIVEDLMEVRWRNIREQIEPDVEINLNGTLEASCIARREQPEFHLPVGTRRLIYGNNGFYDSVFERCGIPIPNPIDLCGLYFPLEIIEWAVNWRRKHEGKFIVMLVINGSSIHKQFRNWKQVCRNIVDKYDDAIVYLCGDKATAAKFDHPRVKFLSHETVPVKQVILMTKYADIVIGPETCTLVAAGMWGTPKIMMCSASSVWQCTQYQLNDFSIQLHVPCSPCHLSVYEADDCENMLPAGYPACVKQFPVQQTMETIGYVHEHLRRELP